MSENDLTGTAVSGIIRTLKRTLQRAMWTRIAVGVAAAATGIAA